MSRQILFRIMRPALWIAYRLALAYWFVVRPKGYGAFVAVWHHDQVLVIRNSYKPQWTFPAGGVKGHETARQAAARELSEEVGIQVAPESLQLVNQFLSRSEYKFDYCTAFELTCTERPQIRVDEFEVVEARFIRLDELRRRRHEFTNVAQLYIDWHAAQEQRSRPELIQ